jgi:predicted nucleic acid-binding protein
MLAVSNTSPISSLAFIGRLDLLKTQFPVVWIPTAVAQELTAHPDRIALETIQAAITAQWIRTGAPQESPLLKILSPQLHRGEAEAIALAADLKADLVIIDEQEGRQLAAQAGLSVIGVLGILLRAKQNGQISAVKPELRALRDRARFFIAPALEAKILAAAGE